MQDRVQKILEKARIYKSAASEWRTHAQEDLDFANGAQWTKEQIDALEAKDMAPIVVNVISPTVDQAVAMLTSNKPRFSATARENGDTKVGALFADLLEYVWDMSNVNTELKTAIYDYYIRGIGYLLAYHDPEGDFGQGAIRIKSVDPFNVYVDPSSKNRLFDDAESIIVADVKTETQILKLYPGFSEHIDKAIPSEENRLTGSIRYGTEGQTYYSGTQLDSNTTYYDVYDVYSKIKVPYYRVNVKDLAYEKVFDKDQLDEYLQIKAYAISRGNSTDYTLTEPEIAQAEQMLQQYGDVFHYTQDPTTGQVLPVSGPADNDSAAIPGSTTVITPLTFGDLVKQGVIEVTEYLQDRILRELVIGGVLYFTQVMPLSEYPIVPIINRYHRNPYPDSDVRLVRPLQEFINKLHSLIVAHATNSTSLKVFLPRGSVDKNQLEEEWAKAGAAVIEFDADIGQPVIAGPVALPNELYVLLREAKSQIEFIFGIWQLQHGNPEATPSTFKGTIAIDEFGQRRIKSKRDDIEAAINALARVVVEFIQAYFSKERTLRLIQPMQEPKELQINIPIYDDYTNEIVGKLNDVTVGKYDVKVISGSTLPSNRWARFDYYMQLYQAGIIDDIELLKQTEVADIDGVLKRKSIYTQLQSALQQAQQEIKKLSGDLQTAEREAMHANKKAELAKWKAQLSSLKSKLKLAVDLTIKENNNGRERTNAGHPQS